jgi:hypothetical protein
MSIARHAYDSGSADAKLAFFGELYNKYVKGDTGPMAAGLLTGHPLLAGLAGAAGQAVDTPPGGSKILRSLGVGGGAALANKLLGSTATLVAAGAVSAMGLTQGTLLTNLVQEGLRDIPLGLAQGFAASKGRDLAERAETFLKAKDTRVPR